MKREKKKLTTYFLIAVITMFCCFGQTLAQSKKQLTFDTKPKTYALEKNQDLVVFINNIGKYDAVTIEGQVGQANASNSIEVKGWEFFYNNNGASSADVGASQIERIGNLPEQSIEVKGNTLVVTNSLADNKRAAIHLLVPTGITAKIYVNGKLFQNGTFSSSAMVQGSRMVSSDKGYSPRATMLQAMSRENTSDQSVLRKIDAQTLRKLATKVVSPPKVASKGQSWAVVQVTVNHDGVVTSVFRIAGDEKLANISSQTLEQFTFQPFLVDDKPIIVTSLVSITNINGEIKLFAEMPK